MIDFINQSLPCSYRHVFPLMHSALISCRWPLSVHFFLPSGSEQLCVCLSVRVCSERSSATQPPGRAGEPEAAESGELQGDLRDRQDKLVLCLEPRSQVFCEAFRNRSCNNSFSAVKPHIMCSAFLTLCRDFQYLALVDNAQDRILTFSSVTGWAVFSLSLCPCGELSFFSAFVFIPVATQAVIQLAAYLLVETGHFSKAQSQKYNQRGFKQLFAFRFICVKLFIDPMCWSSL